MKNKVPCFSIVIHLPFLSLVIVHHLHFCKRIQFRCITRSHCVSSSSFSSFALLLPKSRTTGFSSLWLFHSFSRSALHPLTDCQSFNGIAGAKLGSLTSLFFSSDRARFRSFQSTILFGNRLFW